VAERLLERLGGEVLRYRPVARQVDEIAVNVVEMALDRGREGRDGVAGRGGRDDAHAGCTPPGQRDVTRRGRRLRRPGRARTARAGRTAGRPAKPGARAAGGPVRRPLRRARFAPPPRGGDADRAAAASAATP